MGWVDTIRKQCPHAGMLTGFNKLQEQNNLHPDAPIPFMRDACHTTFTLSVLLYALLLRPAKPRPCRFALPRLAIPHLIV